jgi:hypothetical protein
MFPATDRAENSNIKLLPFQVVEYLIARKIKK